MAAPQIPNLKTLRNPGKSGRTPGRLGPTFGSSSSLSAEVEGPAKDGVIQRTDQDASVSRMSAVEIGYLDDAFADLFVTSNEQRRFPIINRGTYVRTTAIDNLVHRFLSGFHSKKKQIISLGAGSDTRSFRLFDHSPGHSLVYHEIDFAANTADKISTITRSPSLGKCIRGPIIVSPDRTALHAQNYHVHPLDLRCLARPDPTLPDRQLLEVPHIDPSLPTLLISECCLIYLAPTAADAVAAYFTRHLFPPTTPLGFILYEPINPFDAFGKVMVSNLAQRGIVMQTLRKYSSLEAQTERMRGYGFVGKGAADVNFLWGTGVSKGEKERVAALEMVDEVEEWKLLAEHYCVVWGWRGEDEEGTWDGWREVSRQVGEWG